MGEELTALSRIKRRRRIRRACAIALLVVLIAFAVWLLFFQNAIQYGVIVLAAILFAFLVWKAFIKSPEDKLNASAKNEVKLKSEIDTLKREVNSLNRLLAEKDQTSMNVVEMSPVLHVALMTLDTSFVRTFQRERDDLTFNGALKVDLCAEYGIRLEDVLFHYDEQRNLLQLAHFRPGMISYSKKQLNWVIAQSTRQRSANLFRRNPRAVLDDATDAYTKEMCEEIRSELEKEIDTRQVQELDWMAEPLKQQVIGMLKYSIHLPQVDVQVVDVPDETFVDLPAFQRQMSTMAFLPPSDAGEE